MKRIGVVGQCFKEQLKRCNFGNYRPVQLLFQNCTIINELDHRNAKSNF